MVEREVDRRQGVISGDATAGGLDSHKAVGNVAPDVLSCLRPKIPIENVVAAIE
jgi:hypothetical protein